MRDPKTHERALRAALQVARGNRKQTAAALTGVAMLTGCGGGGGATGDTTDDSSPTVEADGATGTATDAVQGLLDAMDAAASQDTGPAATGEILSTGGEDDAVSSPVDASPDPMDGDIVLPCIDSCWQPNDTMCTIHTDCNTPEVLGTCEVTAAPCNWSDQVCPDEQMCEGYEPPREVYVDPDTGELHEFSSELKCIDGMCHEGDAISEAAQACCGFSGTEDNLPWCDEMAAPMAGCTPWGPPAPPVHDGTTLAQRMQRWLS